MEKNELNNNQESANGLSAEIDRMIEAAKRESIAEMKRRSCRHFKSENGLGYRVDLENTYSVSK